MPNPSNHVYALKHVYVPVWLSRHFMNPDHALCYKAGVLTPTEGIGDELVQVVHLHDLVCRVRATPNGLGPDAFHHLHTLGTRGAANHAGFELSPYLAEYVTAKEKLASDGRQTYIKLQVNEGEGADNAVSRLAERLEALCLLRSRLLDVAHDTTVHMTTFQQHHAAWVREQGWHMKSPLEIYALLCSEVFEYQAAETCHERSEELADVVLRTLDFMYLIPAPFVLNREALRERARASVPALANSWLLVQEQYQEDGEIVAGYDGVSVEQRRKLLALTMETLANGLRKGEGEVVTTALNVLLLAVLAQPEWRGFQQCVIADKIVKNAWRGNRGRRV